MTELDLNMHMAITGSEESAAAITRVREAITHLSEPIRRAQAHVKRLAESFDSVSTNATAATTKAASAVEGMNGKILAETRQIRSELAVTFNPLATSAKEGTTAASASMSGLTTETSTAIEKIRTVAATAFAPIAESMATATEAVTAGLTKVHESLAATIAQAKVAAGELKALNVAPSATPNASLRRAARRGHTDPHFRPEGIRVPGAGHISLGSTPVMAGAAIAGYSVWEAAKAQDEAIKTALTSPADAAMLGLTPDDYQRRIMAGSAETGADIAEIAEAYRTATRATQGIPAAERLKLVDALLPKAMAEAKLKGSSLPEALEALIGLSHMTGKYDIDSVKTMANKFSVASLAVNASLPEFSKTLGYSLPTLHAGLGIDEDTIIALTSALYGAGIKSTRSGTWVRSFYQGALRNGNEKHDTALAMLGIGDRSAWEVKGADGRQDWGKSTDRLAEILRKHTAGLSEENKAKYLHDAFGERGSSVAALLSQKSIQEQYDGIRSKITSGAEIDLFKQYSESSSLMQAQKTWRDTQNLLIDIGQTALPAVNASLRDFDNLVKEVAAAMGGDWKGLLKDFFGHLLGPDIKGFKRLYGVPSTEDPASTDSEPAEGAQTDQKPRSWLDRATGWVSRNYRENMAFTGDGAGFLSDGVERGGSADPSPASAASSTSLRLLAAIWSEAKDIHEAIERPARLQREAVTSALPEIPDGSDTGLRSPVSVTLSAALRLWQLLAEDVHAIRQDIERPSRDQRDGISGAASGFMKASYEMPEGSGSGFSGSASGSGRRDGGFDPTGFGGKAAGGKWWTIDRMKHAVGRLMNEAHLSRAGAEALVARWKYVEAAGGPTSVNPRSGAAGIAQWLGSRKGGFTADYDSQLTKVIGELNGPEKHAAAILRQAKDAAQGALGATAFERAEGWNGSTDHFTPKTFHGAQQVSKDLAEPRYSGPMPAKADAGKVARSSGGSSRGPVVHRHRHGDINVNGINDPEQAANAVMRKLAASRDYNTTDTDFDT